MIKCKLCMNIHFLHCVPTERFLYGYYFYTHNVPMERVHHNSFSCELSRKATNNFYNLGIYSKENKSSSTKFGNVTFKFGSLPLRVLWRKLHLRFLPNFFWKSRCLHPKKALILIFGRHLQNHPITFRNRH